MKILLAILFSNCLAVSTAQDIVAHRAFLAQGKVWRYITVERVTWPLSADEYAYYSLRGDTVIEGRTWMKLYRKKGNGEPEYHSAMMERDSRVYRIMADSQTEELLYDFSLKEGDKVPTHEGMHVGRIDTVTTVHDGREEHFLRFRICDDSGTETGRMVDGIGGLGGVSSNNLDWAVTGDHETFESCSLDGTELFDFDDLRTMIWVEEEVGIRSAESETGTSVSRFYYTLDGRVLDSPAGRGVYIVREVLPSGSVTMRKVIAK